MEELELAVSEMFARIVQAGLSPEDSAMVAKAQAIMRQLAAHTEAALALGALTMGALFDTDYVPVAGTNQQLFRTRLRTGPMPNGGPCLIAPRRVMRACSPPPAPT
jgi:methyl-accepting chemotaxis protein